MKRSAVVLVTFILLAAGCESTSTAPSTQAAPESTVTTATETDSTPAPQPEPSTPVPGKFEPSDDCFGGGIQALGTTCGYVTVPLDYDDPEAGTIQIATLFVDNGASDRPPVMYFPGGPGASAVDGSVGFYDAPFDVLLMDERGVGASEPSLNCPELDALFPKNLTEPILERRTGDAYMAALEACRVRLVDEGVDLDAFGSDRSARDIGVVHRSLGFDDVDIWGVSGGTRLALTKLRDDPDGMRSLTLDSVVPVDVNLFENTILNASRSIDFISDICASQPACVDGVGDFLLLFERLRAELDADPITVRIDLPSGSSADTVIDGDALVDLVFTSLHDRRLIPTIPATLAAAADGSTEGLERMKEHGLAWPNFSEGMFLSVLCREEFPFNDSAEIIADRVQGNAALEVLAAVVPPQEGECDLWNVDAAEPIENEPVANPLDIPVLVFAGAFDPITPPAWSRLVAERLGGTYVEVPDGGHAVATANSCTAQIFGSFLADPETPPDTACVDGLEPPTFRGFDG